MCGNAVGFKPTHWADDMTWLRLKECVGVRRARVYGMTDRCFVLYCIVLYCFVLFYFVLYCIILYYIYYITIHVQLRSYHLPTYGHRGERHGDDLAALLMSLSDELLHLPKDGSEPRPGLRIQAGFTLSQEDEVLR